MPTQTLSLAFRYSHTIGRNQGLGVGFRHPVAMVRGNEDLIYVVSRGYDYRPGDKRLTICTVEEEYLGAFCNGDPVRRDGPSANEYFDSFVWPTSISLDQEGNVYVSDEWLNRITIFTKDGEPVGGWGIAGDGDGEINGPSGLAFDAENSLYVVDSKNNRIQKFTSDGTFLAKWGGEGHGDGEFDLPWGIDIDSNGDVYVADWHNDRIQKFSPTGQFLMKFGTSGNGDGELNRPTGVAVDKDGTIYVADWGNDRLQVFDQDGKFTTKMTGEATLSKWAIDKLNANPDMWNEREVAQGLEREKQFWGPIAVEVDDDGRVFVVESARHRIQVFRKVPPYFLGRFDGGRL